VVLKWDGVEWQEIPFPKAATWVNSGFNAILLTTKSDGWAADQGSMYRWNGNSWNTYDQYLPPFSMFDTIYAISAASPDDIWAVGANLRDSAGKSDGGPGIIIHWDGVSWKKVTTASHVLVAVKMLSATQGWAVGMSMFGIDDGGQSNNVVLHWDGHTWSEFPVPTKVSLTTICGFDQDHIWISANNYDKDLQQYFPIWLRLLPQIPSATPAATLTKTQTLIPTSTRMAVLSTHTIATPVPTRTHPPVHDTNDQRLPLWMILGTAIFVLLIVMLGRASRKV
jgi:hypothetical protein